MEDFIKIGDCYKNDSEGYLVKVMGTFLFSGDLNVSCVKINLNDDTELITTECYDGYDFLEDDDSLSITEEEFDNALDKVVSKIKNISK